MSDKTTKFKELAAQAAVELVQAGMVVGLGHGSTVHFALLALGARISSGELNDLIGIPCSKQTEAIAKEMNIPLGDINKHTKIDLTIDGADEIDPDFNLIKGGGGALLREKLVAQASKREIIIVDENKLSPALGTNFPVPVEVASFGWATHIAFIAELGGKAVLRNREDGSSVITDQGNYLLDCQFGPISDPHELAHHFEQRSGILEHGLFLGIASDVIVAGAAGIQHHKIKK